MSHKNWVWSLMCGAALVTAVTTSAQVNVSDKSTHVTFSSAVELPGLTLPPGTYTFRLADHNVDRHIVQVFDRDGKKLGADILAMPARRLERTDDTIVTFHEMPADMTPAVRYWYYPNDLVGEEFAYPREQALRIANATQTAVLGVEGDEVARVEPAAAPAAVQERAEVVPQQPQPEVTSREPDAPAVGMTGRRLPQTASSLPLVTLLGFLSLGGAMGLRLYRSTRD